MRLLPVEATASREGPQPGGTGRRGGPLSQAASRETLVGGATRSLESKCTSASGKGEIMRLAEFS